MNEIIEIARELYARQLVSGSAGNISFRDNNIIYISKSGASFRNLDEHSFALFDQSGNLLEGIPSKEYPLHLALYQRSSKFQCVIHTHSYHSVMFSCLKNLACEWVGLYRYTPYLKMKTDGQIRIVNPHKPGSKELFDEFNKVADEHGKAYLLSNHGLVAAGESAADAFNLIEEFEQSSRLLLNIKQYTEDDYAPIVNEN